MDILREQLNLIAEGQFDLLEATIYDFNNGKRLVLQRKRDEAEKRLNRAKANLEKYKRENYSEYFIDAATQGIQHFEKDLKEIEAQLDSLDDRKGDIVWKGLQKNLG